MFKFDVRPYTKFVRPIVFYPELAIRLPDETIHAWCVRHRKVTGKDPKYDEIRMSPFYHTEMPKCKDLTKFYWCVRSIGSNAFLDYLDDDMQCPNKLWVFNNESDAVQFKLTWLNVDTSDDSRTL